MVPAFIETLEGRQFMSVAPMAGAQVRAGAPVGSGDLIQQRDRDRLQDGSCQLVSTSTATTSAKIRARKAAATGDLTRQRDRLQDGSCQTTTASASVVTTKAPQRAQLRDGSCRS